MRVGVWRVQVFRSRHAAANEGVLWVQQRRRQRRRWQVQHEEEDKGEDEKDKDQKRPRTMGKDKRPLESRLCFSELT